MARAGRSVLIVSHNMHTIESLCERTIHLSAGRLVGDGKPADVVAGYLTEHSRRTSAAG